MFILRNEVDQVLKRIATQKQAEIGGTIQECYDETLADYQSGIISDAFIDFWLKNPDAQLFLGFGDDSARDAAEGGDHVEG